MAKFPHFSHLSEAFCDHLKIENVNLKIAIKKIFHYIDTENYFSIKAAVTKIKALLNKHNMSIGDTKILNAIAKSLKYKNHHEMKTKTYPNTEQLNNALVQNIHNIYKKHGIKGLLPQNLPDHVLKTCSYQYESYIEESEKIDISGLFLVIMLVQLQNKSPKPNEDLSLEMAPEEFNSYIHSYGFSISLEELRRIEVITIRKESLPTESNILDNNRKGEVIFKI